ncbi:helicase C-terminal domain-containing protein [Acidovorax sp. PRC11]|uniref:helicase C-terminal domain-containing protein n=1 Tax=Acidovorax sp. PRC11 TaxID=2962592 RepID=UPI00288293D7|nr:helicase C-terminal domain-containing protein [Acidovorax sp. PRC11]MDT0139108.1 helicase C-terminal domain-containing protein [Acidovorax sp. PRC11]
MLDFDALGGAGDGTTGILEPRQIFTTLQRQPRFKFPSANQGEVLDKWFEKRERVDNTIKMNTGSGKMLVGLLALQSCLNEKIGPAAYIAPDNYLVGQVLQEAQDLGIAVTQDTNHAGFQSGSAILIANIDKLVNGRSVFGVGLAGTRITLGSVVIDDAHACLDAVADQFSIDLPSGHAAYSELWNLFSDDLKKYSYVGWLEIARSDIQSLMAVPFWVWQDKSAQVIAILDAHRDTQELKFSWPLLKGVIPLCVCVFGANGLQIKPRCMPIEQIPAFARAKRRIYMTATLADDGVLITHLNANPAAIADPIKPKGAGEIGDRMIVAPQEVNPEIKDEEVRTLAKAIASKHNVVVLVPSFARAKFWEDVANQTLSRETIANGVAALKAKHVGLTVLVNRYDGVDLPEDACRLLIVDGIPEVHDLAERLDAMMLDGTELQLLRQIQRIEQGMGRGVRSNEDRCAVLLLGARLTQRVNSPEARRMFTPATLAQIDLGKEVTRQLKGKAIFELQPILELCINKDSKWWLAGRQRLAKAPEGSVSHIDTATPLLRKAFDLATLGQWTAAAAALQPAVHAETAPMVRGYLKQQLAELINPDSPIEAQKLLLAGILDNPRILKPLQGVSYKRIPTNTRSQGENAEEFVRTRFIDPNGLVLWTKALLADLSWDPDRTDAFEAAMQELGRFIGFGSQRPDKTYKDGGPDNLWAMTPTKFAIIECKSGVADKDKAITKDFCNQLLGSESWFKNRYEANATTDLVIVHPSSKFGDAASPSTNMRVIDVQSLDKLKMAIDGFAKAVIFGDTTFAPPARIAEALVHFGLDSAHIISRYTVKPS